MIKLFRFDDGTAEDAIADPIVDIIVTLPKEQRAALVELVRQGARLARKDID